MRHVYPRGHSFSKYLVSTYCVLGVLLGAADTGVSQTDEALHHPRAFYLHGGDR